MKTVPLDKGLPVPLYHQLKTVLLDRLRHGHWRPDDQLPTEAELGTLFGVSKATVRQALRDLAQAGLVRREQGRGTFVVDTKIQFGPRQLSSFTEEMRDTGRVAGSRVLDCRIAAAGADIAHRLQIPEGAELFLLRRLRLAEGEPMGFETAHIAAQLVPGILEIDFQTASLYETLERRYGLAAEHATQRHSAVALGCEEAALLGVPAGSPALSGERLTFLPGGRPLELTFSVMRGDRYHIQLRLIRPAGRPDDTTM